MSIDPETQDEKNDILCIVVTYNSADHISACLESIASQSCAPVVVVHDNASTDCTAAIAAGCRPQSLQQSSTNLGFAAAVNSAADSYPAPYRYLLLLNPDTILHSGAIAALIDFAKRTQGAGIWGGCALTPRGDVEPACCLASPNLWHALTYGLGLTLIPRATALRPDSLGGWDRRGERQVPALTGAFLLIDSDLWRELGGFDERFFMYGEDVDLCLRARALGRSVMYTDNAVCTHVGAASSKSRADHLVLLLAGRSQLYDHYACAPALAKWMLKLGTALRAGLEGWLRPSERAWRDAWRRRLEWQSGWHQPAIGFGDGRISSAVESRRASSR